MQDDPRPEKVAVVKEVQGRLAASSAAILAEYRGLSVKDMSALRRSLRAAGGEIKVYKNTLVRFAARDSGLEHLESLLQGPTAIAFVDTDAASVAKALRDFSRTNPALVIKGGVLGDKVLTPADANALAELPSREVLLARLAGALSAPMVQFAGLLQALPRNFAYGLKALIDKGGASPADAQSAEEASPASATSSNDAGNGAGATEAPDDPASAGSTVGTDGTGTTTSDQAPDAATDPAGDTASPLSTDPDPSATAGPASSESPIPESE